MGKINKRANWKSRDKNGRFISEKQHKDLNNKDSYCYGLPLLPHDAVKLDHAYSKTMAPLQVINFKLSSALVHEMPTIGKPTESVM